MNLGAHMSIAGGIWKSLERGKEHNSRVIQVFTKSSNQWRAMPLTKDAVRAFHEARKATGVFPAMAHDSYLINLGSPQARLWKKSCSSLRIELQRAERLGIPYVVAHPGAHTGAGERFGLKRISMAIRSILRETSDWKVSLLLETTAGQGTSIGHRFEQLGEMLDRVGLPDRTGVCLDTCHVFAAGYDWRTQEGYEAMWDEFDQEIGLKMLKAFHLNDSKGKPGGRLDRHEHIGRGEIGSAAFGRLMRDKRFWSIPMVLETPKDEKDSDRRNLTLLRRLRSSKGPKAKRVRKERKHVLSDR
ncbi:MAG: deoxyribonuclease IV [Planctomycetota bacterium]|nr:deoxyribonuclease IV [Planctomycetota bacterium]